MTMEKHLLSGTEIHTISTCPPRRARSQHQCTRGQEHSPVGEEKPATHVDGHGEGIKFIDDSAPPL